MFFCVALKFENWLESEFLFHVLLILEKFQIHRKVENVVKRVAVYFSPGFLEFVHLT